MRLLKDWDITDVKFSAGIFTGMGLITIDTNPAGWIEIVIGAVMFVWASMKIESRQGDPHGTE